MIPFEEEYFKEEYREGFLVSEEMKRAWAAEMEVLSEIIRVCEKYGLTYYADYGTLLGTIRHQGFIPWDDDIDISMPRKDYERLFRVLPQELPESYVTISVFNDIPVPSTIGRVVNRSKVGFDDLCMNKFHGCPYIVGVDIFVLDNIPDDEELEDTHITMYKMVQNLAENFDELERTGELWDCLPQVEEICMTKLVRDNTLKSQLWRLADRVAKLFEDDQCHRQAFMGYLANRGKSCICEKSWRESVHKLSFEGKLMINVPDGYDQILKGLYGDYMTPVRGETRHDYPYFKNQKELYISHFQQK